MREFERSFTKNLSKFADHKIITCRLNALVYFAHPHSPWERGTNENTNRLLRQYFLKKTKATYPAVYLADYHQKLNTDLGSVSTLSPLATLFLLSENFAGGISRLNLPLPQKFVLHLKGSECRFNHRDDNFASFIERIFWKRL